MKQFQLRTLENLQPAPGVEYINECCRFGDRLLEVIKRGIGEKLSIAPTDLITGQEDWGWFLEFEKDRIFYELGISYRESVDESAYDFGMTIEAHKLEKGFFLDKKIEYAEAGEVLAKIVQTIAKENDLEIFEE